MSDTDADEDDVIVPHNNDPEDEQSLAFQPNSSSYKTLPNETRRYRGIIMEENKTLRDTWNSLLQMRMVEVNLTSKI